MSLATARLWLLALMLPLIGGCATYSSIDNQPKYGAIDAGVVDTEGYGLGRASSAKHRDDITVVVAFSGGGARAAALAYGVLLELRDTDVATQQGSGSLLEEVDAISAVSGGSFTAAYYGLHGEAMFPTFKQTFLQNTLGDDLLRRFLNPFRWFSPVGRTAAAARLYDRKVFDGARFADLQARNGPLVIINASDVESGTRFAFLQGYFDLLCSDLLSYPLADAVAASSAVPVLFEPVVLENFDTCHGPEPVAPVGNTVSPQLQQAAEGLQGYQDKKAHRYVHLADGGLTDNLGLRAFQEAIELSGGLSAFLQRIDRKPARHIVVISVDSSGDAASGLGLTPRAPSLAQAIDAVTDIQLHRYNAATLELIQDSLKQWTADVSTPALPVQSHLVLVSLDNIPDPQLRAQLAAVPTGFSLSPEQADALVAAGRRLLRDNPEFRTLLQALNGPAPTERAP